MRTPLLVSLIALLGACDSDPIDREIGRFEATLSGDLAATLAGDAAYTAMSDPLGERGVSITMIPDGSPTHRSLGIVDRLGTIDGEGSYTFGLDDLEAVGLVYFDASASLQLIAADGTLRVNRFTDGEIAGTFEATLREGFVDGEGRTVSVEGTFAATPLPFRR